MECLSRIIHSTSLTIRDIHDPKDPSVPAFIHLLHRVFADASLISPREKFEGWIARRNSGARRFHLLVAEADGQVVGGTMFSYMPAADTGLSELIAVDPARRGLGLARRLFDARLETLRADAAACGGILRGLLVEVANPDRLSPAAYQAEVNAGIDPRERRRIMAHLGFRQLDMVYLPPPFAPGQPQVDYLDLLFLPLDAELDRRGAVPPSLIIDTLRPMWAALGSADWEQLLDRTAAQIQDQDVALIPVQGG